MCFLPTMMIYEESWRGNCLFELLRRKFGECRRLRRLALANAKIGECLHWFRRVTSGGCVISFATFRLGHLRPEFPRTAASLNAA